MPKVEKIYYSTLSNAGVTETISVTEGFSEYVYDGTGVLGGNISITTSGSPISGTTIIINWNCTFTAGIGGVTILGTAIPTQFYGKSFVYKTVYNGSGWDAVLIPDMTETQFIDNTMIVNTTLTGAKLADATVSLAKLANDSNIQTEALEISFETGEQCNNTIQIPTAFTVNRIYLEVIKALAATDAGTIIPKINGTNITLNTPISLAASTAINTTSTYNCTALNTGTADALLSFVAAKTTAGGIVRITVKLTKS